jgi:hypothetical protein
MAWFEASRYAPVVVRTVTTVGGMEVPKFAAIAIIGLSPFLFNSDANAQGAGQGPLAENVFRTIL